MSLHCRPEAPPQKWTRTRTCSRTSPTFGAKPHKKEGKEKPKVIGIDTKSATTTSTSTTASMDQRTNLCLQVGSASSADAGAFSNVVQAVQLTDIVAARQALQPRSLYAFLLVLSASDLTNPQIFNPMELANWVQLLTDDASVAIQVVGNEGGETNFQPVHTSFLLSGLAVSTERKLPDGSRVFTAKRKVTKTVSAPLRSNTAAAAAAATTASQRRQSPTSTVTISLNDDDDDDDKNAMIDEDALLEDDTLLAPPPAMSATRTAGDDCDGREPCENCTCGRADAPPIMHGGSNPKPKQQQEMVNAPSSSCGKCSLGDAFRCASCPYLGKPAFKPGEEHLILNLTDDL